MQEALKSEALLIKMTKKLINDNLPSGTLIELKHFN